MEGAHLVLITSPWPRHECLADEAPRTNIACTHDERAANGCSTNMFLYCRTPASARSGFGESDQTVDVEQCDDPFHSKSFKPEDCMRTFSQSVSTRLLSSLQSTEFQSATPSQKPQDSGPYQPVSTSTHGQSNTVSTRFASHETQRDVTKHFFPTTPLFADDVCNDSISVECPPPVDARSQRAMKRDNACSPASHEISSAVVVR